MGSVVNDRSAVVRRRDQEANCIGTRCHWDTIFCKIWQERTITTNKKKRLGSFLGLLCLLILLSNRDRQRSMPLEFRAVTNTVDREDWEYKDDCLPSWTGKVRSYYEKEQWHPGETSNCPRERWWQKIALKNSQKRIDQIRDILHTLLRTAIRNAKYREEWCHLIKMPCH